MLLLGSLVGVVPAPVAGQEAAPFRGVVVDGVDGSGIEDAEVRVTGPVRRTLLSGPSGAFGASLPPGRYDVTVRHLAYGDGVATLRVPSGEPLRVELTPRAIPLGELVVTAGRRLQTLGEAPVTTELVTRAEIEASGASDIGSVLMERTGIQLEGGHPAGEGLMLQGLGAERVLVLVDGQPFIGRLAGSLDISRLPATIVERVEVVKGPQSTLYGSEAMGGVVNVITRRGNGAPAVGGSVVAGGQGRRDVSLQGGGRLSGMEVWGSGGARVRDLVPGRADSAGARVERRDALVKLSRRVGSVELEGSALAVDESQRWATGQLVNFADNVQWSTGLSATWTAGAHRLAPALHLTSFDHLARRGPSSTPPPEETGTRQVQTLQEAELLYGWTGDDVDVDLGIEAAREHVEGESLQGGRRSETTAEFFGQATFDLGAATVVPGTRVSWSDQWGVHATPRVAVLVRPVPSVAVRAAVGTGYRAPDAKELFMRFLNTGPGFGYVVRGNRELVPESSVNLTTAIEWSAPRVYGRIQAFVTRYDHFIETVALPDSAGVSVYRYGNVDEGRTAGVELEAGWTSPSFGVEAGWAFLHARDRVSGLPLLGRPPRSGRITLRAPLPGNVSAFVTGVHTGATPIMREGGTTVEREAWTRVDGRISVDVTHGVGLSVGVDNVFDQTPESWPGFTGRLVHLGLDVEHRW